MRTVIYARFSHENQNPRSTADQIALCRERADREGWQIVGTFEDAAISGAAGIGEDQRPGLNAMMRMVESGGVDQVLAESTDRIARHVADAHNLRERMEFAGARLFTLFDGTVTPMIGLVKGFMDAQFRTDLAKRVRRGQVGTVKQGRASGGIPYGYVQANRLDDKGGVIRGLREIDPDKAAIVVRIFTEYARGKSPFAIATDLNADGVPGPRGKLWYSTALYGEKNHKRGILRNEIYIGVLTYGRSRQVVNPQTRRRLMRHNSEEDVLRVPVPDMRIIDDDLWQKVQDQLEANSTTTPHRARRPKHILSGIAVCGVCGANYVLKSGTHWGCSVKKYGGACTNGRLISTEDFERRVLADLKSGMLAPDVVSAYVREYHRDFARAAADLGRDRGKIERKLEDAKRRKERLLTAFAEGGSEFAEIRDLLTKARADFDQLTRELANMDAVPTVLTLHPHMEEVYRRQVEELEQALSAPEAKLEAVPRLRAMLARVVVHPNLEKKRGVIVEVVRQMDEILSLATGTVRLSQLR
ncbi:recombinase family protein [Sphingobium sp. V4]|uniref:recombinase family protein n=1 Tax=Sphingobium sp. V4 TaxID=3038927 RepID=UPI002558021B|nr:recombinase family protein [Sphingobium sp. V4]WIW88996.1 recombinase family protein [Sphingobium sp. V4]